jgi:acylphosphatase
MAETAMLLKMIRRTTHFSGNVQGVGFRFTARLLAQRYPAVRGYVRNLPDGRVELVAEGEVSDIDKLLADIDRQMEGYVKKRTDQDSPWTGEFKDFSVRH